MRILVLLLFFACVMSPVGAVERVGVLYDSIIQETSPYTAYTTTPPFLAQDIMDSLRENKGLSVVPLTQVRSKLAQGGINSRDVANLRNIKYGYDLDFVFLKKISKALSARYLVVVVQSVEMERDFLKNTAWNVLNIAGFDTVNPTHRVNIYAVLVDTQNESVLWEEMYAKNIRNNKFKNLDAELAGNWEGMMRLKQYSKYVSPEIAVNVGLALAPEGVTPEVYVNKMENVALKINKKVQLGSNKKLRNDNAVIHTTFVTEQKAVDATKKGAKKVGKGIKDLFKAPVVEPL